MQNSTNNPTTARPRQEGRLFTPPVGNTIGAGLPPCPRKPGACGFAAALGSSSIIQTVHKVWADLPRQRFTRAGASPAASALGAPSADAFAAIVGGDTTTRPAQRIALVGAGVCYLDLTPLEMTHWLECWLANDEPGAARVLDLAAHRIRMMGA